MSLGEGAKIQVRQQIEQLGSNFIIVISGQMKRGMPGQSFFKQTTFDAIVEECTNVQDASPMMMQTLKAVYEGESKQAAISGGTPSYFTIREWPAIKGELFSDHDVKTGKKVVVIGKKIAQDLFGSADPIDKRIRIKKMPFTVIGVLKEKGVTPDGFDQDTIIFMPISTMQRKIAGVTNKFFAMMFSAKNKKLITRTASQIRSIIRQQRKLIPEDEDDFTIFTQDDITQTTDAMYAILNMLLLLVASIALLVGGIGIMNIMLVTVTERTREIGIRMALGAQSNHILNQFIFEAIIICLFGGTVGIVLGLGIAQTISYFLKWGLFISFPAIGASLIVSTLIGVFFGFYPAWKASKLNPVDALAEH